MTVPSGGIETQPTHSQNTSAHNGGAAFSAEPRGWTLHDFFSYHASRRSPVSPRNKNDVNCIYLSAAKGAGYLSAKLISRMGWGFKWNYAGWFQSAGPRLNRCIFIIRLENKGQIWRFWNCRINEFKASESLRDGGENGRQQSATSKWQRGATLASAESRGLSLNK